MKNIICLVGPFGSGCSYVARIICEMRGYIRLSLSDILREEFKKEYDRDPEKRTEMQDFGNLLRERHGADYLAAEALTRMDGENYVLDSIRNPEEIKRLKAANTNTFLIGVFANQDLRWKRVSRLYHNDKREFEKDDERDSGEKKLNGQKVTETFRLADIIIKNESDCVPGNKAYEDLCTRVMYYVDLIERKRPYKPEHPQAVMTMAYAASLLSSCLKRQVGAVITDERGNVFSSGYNDVPTSEEPCKHVHGQCYRDTIKQEHHDLLIEKLGEGETAETAFECFKFKNLDYCRALHAEENAILNVTRNGQTSALKTATLYTTTYPCNLCANKIAQVGIKEVVYFEPYPMEEAKKILTANEVKQRLFDGVTYNGYFRLMEVVG